MAIFFFLLLFGLSSASYLPNGCPEDPHIHLLLPHETDCTKFYYCVHGEKHLRQCSGGLYFDPVYQVCNWPQNVDCQPTHVTTESVTTTENEVATTEKTTDTTTNYLTTTESSVTTDRNEESTEIITPEQPTAEPTTKESTTVEPTTEESTTVEPTTKESTTVEPTTENPTTVEPTTEESTTEQSTTVEPTTEESTTVEPTTAEPSTEESTTVEPTTEESTTVEPTTENPTTVEPTTEESTTEQSTTVEPTTEESPTEEPTTVEPTTATTEMTIDSEGTTIEVSTVTEPTTNESESSNESRDVESSREPALTTERTVPTTEQQPETPAICPPGFIGNVPHPERCDSYFLCSGWEPIQLFCAPGLEFDAALQICVAIAEGGCNWQNGQLTSTTTHPSTDEESTTTITEEETTTEPATELTTETTVPTTEQQPETPTICPPGFVGNVPHPERCDSYFLCSGWESIQLFCAPGLEFDATLQICVAIAEGGCNWQNGQLTSTTTHTTTEQESTTTTTEDQTVPTTETTTASEAPVTGLTTETTLSTTEQQPETPAICPPGFIGNVPHPERCDSYFLCSGWEPIQLFCAPGLEFDADLQICVAIAEGGCNWQNGQLTSTTIHPSTDEESTTRTTEEQTVSTTESQTTSEAPVTDLTTETTLSTTEGPITITTDVPTTVTIEEQTLSTTESQATTDEPATELTTEDKESTTEKQPETSAICPPGFIGNVPHPERCDSYFLCSGWEPIQLFCAPGLEFDAALQTCVAIAEGGCNWQNGQLTSTTAEPSTDGDLTTTEFTSEVSTTTTDEQTVSTTESQTATEVSVTETTITTITEDLTTTTEEPETITTTTKDTTITTEVSTTITDEQTATNTDSVGTSTELSTEKTVTTTEQQPETPAICPPGFIGNVPHPERCDSYFLCSGWEPIQLFCAPGLEFDAALQTCVAIAEGGCNWQNGQLTSTTAEPSTDGDLTTTEFTSEVSTITTDKQTVATTESQTEDSVTETTEETTDDITTITENLTTTTEEPETITTTTKDTTITTEESTTITDEQTESTTESVEISTELSTEKTVTTTEQQPETPAVCPPGFIGNVPHPERCDSYFLCSGWEPIQLFCAPGLEFDATLQTCVAIVEGGCNWQNGQLTSTTAEPSTDGDLTTTEFTSEVFTITTDEQTVATTESQPATEESVTETTDDITTVTEDLTTTTEEPGTITTTTKDTTITTEESTTTITDKQTESTTESVEISTTLSTETTEQQPETPAVCPPGFIGNVPHPERCDSYFLCSGWEPIQLFCAPGLEFDAALQTCVAIAEGGCNWQNGQLTSTTAEPSTDGDLTTTEFTSEVSTITDEQTVSTTESQTATEVTVTETTEETTDDLTTITKDLTTTEEPGTITTTTKDTTITTEESTTTITDKQTESTTESVDISTELSTETTVTTTEQQPETPAICPPGFVGNVPHPERCDSYFLCSGWEPIQLFCAPGLEFDAALQTCVAIAEGGCNWQNGQLTSTTAEPSTDGDLTTTEFTSEVSTITTDEQTVATTEFEITMDPTEQTIEDSTATAEGGITTSNSPTTVELTTVTEELEAEPLCPEGFIGSVPHPDRCDSYYMCTGWTPIQLFCLPGQEFDPVLSQCVVIAEDGCTSRLTNEVVNKQETRSQIHKGDVDRNDLNRKADGSRATAEFANRIARTELCPLGFEGRIATPEGKSFYLCSGGNAIELLCPVESKFDPVTGKCIYKNYEKRMRS
ncbi:mucin-22-like isoform X4 [Pectinophora gossypiella]|uniref:mucin-22-like isoform X4 n=1 Tax=Pectinophora gossypiella TaxID=13191 RepID=UPI00214ED27E|nr:mucin-22-like isoform X4 [Pectinophora gossypiella]